MTTESDSVPGCGRWANMLGILGFVFILSGMACIASVHMSTRLQSKAAVTGGMDDGVVGEELARVFETSSASGAVGYSLMVVGAVFVIPWIVRRAKRGK